MRWRIRYQLLVPLLMLLLAVVGSNVWLGYAAVHRVRREIETRVRQVAHNLSEETNYPLAENVLVQMKRLSGADYLWVPDEGAPRSTLDTIPGQLPPPGLAGTVAEDWQTLRLGPPVAIGKQSYLCGGIQLRPRPQRTGGTLYVLYPETLWRDALWEAIGPVVLLGGGVGLASIVLAIGLGQRLSQRVRELERRTRLIAAGDFSPMPLPERNDEIRDLARSVNDMAQKLAQFQEKVRRTERLRLLDQVSGGLAHQLRNGLTGARLAVQLYLQENSRQSDVEALQVALRQLTLLETNLKRFLDLGRHDSLQRKPCSLTALVSDAVALVGPQCRHAGIELRWAPPAAANTFHGDAGQFGQVILNLLGNAIDAAGPGGSIEVRCAPDGDGDGNGSGPLWLEVWDSGPGPPGEIADRLFEPFVTGKREGVGLGLAVTRQVVEAHGGRITWRRQDGRTCFRTELHP
jgi:signal transduction histidine kinase